MNQPHNLLSLSEAQQRILDAVAPVTGAETVPLFNALGRVLAENAVARADVPGHDNSAMDGFALQAADASEGKSQLKLIGKSFAGHPFNGKVGAGECVQIMTGGVMPDGADAVVMQERTVLDGQCLTISGSVRPADNVRGAGEDFAQGDQVLAAGRKITPADLGVLASVGLAEVPVFRQPRIAFFSTGDELRQAGETLAPGEIYDSNRYSLHGLISEMGCEFIDLGVIADNPAALEKAFRTASEGCDAIITTGGVSVGAADHIVAVLASIGDIGFWKVAVKPGKPFAFGKINDALFFGLPGNPVSAMVGFIQYVRPALVQLAGARPAPALRLHLPCTADIRKKPGRLELQRGRIVQRRAGPAVEPFGHQGSGVLRSMSRANCFIVLSAESGPVCAGDRVEVEPFTQPVWQ